MAIFNGYYINKEPPTLKLDLMNIALQRDMSESIIQCSRNNGPTWLEISLIPEPFDEKLREKYLLSYDRFQSILYIKDSKIYIQLRFSEDGNYFELNSGSLVQRDEYNKMANFVHRNLSGTELKDYDFYDTYENYIKLSLRSILYNDHPELIDKVINYLVKNLCNSFVAEHPESFSDYEINKMVDKLLEGLT